MVTGKPELEIKATPTEFDIKATITEFDMANANLGDHRRQTMTQLSYEESFFDLQQTFSAQYFKVSLTLSHWIVGASVEKRL